MSYKPRSDMAPDGFTLPARYYTDPEYFKEEFERFFFHLWIHAGRADQIREPGEYFVRNVGGESVVVARSASGGLTAFYNVCRHRGTRLCQGEEGRFRGSIQCPYHAWTYDLDGRLIGAPHMEEVPHFRREDYPLNRVHVDTWDGHIFLNFSKDPQPLRAQLASLPDKFRPWHMEELRLGGRLHYHIKANWKLILQNYSECLHCPLIHPVLNKLSHYLSGENEPLHPSYMGGVMDLSDGVKTMTLDGQSSREFLPGISLEDSRRVYYYAIFPNMLLTLHPDYMMTHTLWPRACDLTENVCEFYFHPVEMAKPGFSAQDALEFWDLTNKQDWLVSELSQQGISSRAYRPGPYSNREDLLYAFDRMIVAADDEKLEHKR